MDKKVAAIWARVSDPKQEEPSLDRQVAETKLWLEGQGYHIPENKILKAVWTSRKVLNCPEMQQLLEWVKTGQVQAVGMTHLDRLSGKPGHMSQIFETIKEGNCELLAKDTPLPTGFMAEAMVLLISLGKAMQVDKADTGAKSGLKDRAIRRGLAPTMRAPYSYKWQGENVLVPDENYQVARLIWELALAGLKLREIGRELLKRGIPSPRGKMLWPVGTIRAILWNPIYAGRPAGLKYEVREPKRRRVTRDGNTSCRRKPIEEWVWLSNVKVESPVVDWQQFEYVQERLKLNQAYARRNAKRNFLLRGLIKCLACGRHYYGRNRQRTFPIYICNNAKESYDRGCNSKPLPCHEVEADVKDKIRNFLLNPSVYLAEVNKRQGIVDSTIHDLEVAQKRLQRERQDTVNYEGLLARKLAEGRLSNEAFDQEQNLTEIKRKYNGERLAEIDRKLETLQKTRVNVKTVELLRERLTGNLERANDADWRYILEVLGTTVWAFQDGTWDIEVNVPITSEIVSNSP
jgi:site-specific DNA recombinase